MMVRENLGSLLFATLALVALTVGLIPWALTSSAEEYGIDPYLFGVFCGVSCERLLVAWWER